MPVAFTPAPGDEVIAPDLLRHIVLIPAAFAALAVAAQQLGIDFALAGAAFDPVHGVFPARASTWLELVGHRFAKSVVLVVWLLLLAAAIASNWISRLRRHRALLWTTTLAMAAGPIAVVLMKDSNAHVCPWDLKAFGGSADFASTWFVSRAEAGRCFPGGHAAAGFSLIALHFAGVAVGSTGLRTAGLAAALIAGASFSAVRMLQGAHFLSHNLMSAAVVWSLAALAFLPYVRTRNRPACASGRSAR